MIKTTIEVYSLQIKRRDNILDFSEEPDFFNVLADNDSGFVHHVDVNATGDVPTLKRTVRIPATDIIGRQTFKFYHTNRSERYICGVIETGAYGKRYDIANKNSPRDSTYTVTPDQAPIKPFFYFLKIPRRGNKALLILERTDNEGIYPLFSMLLKTFINNLYGIQQGFTLIKRSILLNDYVNELASGRYSSLTLTSNTQNRDASERYFGSMDTSDYTLELSVKFKKDLADDKTNEIKNLINSGNPLFDVPELNDIFENASRKVVTTIGTGRNARTRTLYLNAGSEHIKPYYDIEVEANDKNFSLYTSIKQVVRDFVVEYTEFSNFT